MNGAKRKLRGRLPAMTLTEMLIVLAILGILILMAYPILRGLVTKTRYKEAETALTTLCTLQKGQHAEKAKYTMELKDLGFEQEKLVSEENGKAHFRIEIVSADGASFLARATAITDFDGDGQFCVYEITPDCTPKMILED
jgi:type IV pilus assembly protein PilE